MKYYFKHIIIASILSASFLAGGVTNAQEVIEIPSLFEYPVAPDELQSMEDKSGYVIEHFWDKFNFKSKQAVDQNALNHAFGVYATAMRFADLAQTMAVNKKLIDNLSKNPTYLLQFTKAAEENIYGPRADVWIDDIYLQFLDALLNNKKISQARKTKYLSQRNSIVNSKVGSTPKKFGFKDSDGKDGNYFPMSTPTLLVFGDPSDTDWRLARLKMESNINLTKALEKGQVNILFIYTGNSENWAKNVDNYSRYWTVGRSEEAADHYDLRLKPAIYVVGADGKILDKNISLPTAVDLLLNQIKDK